jgi:hypothetical protein
MTPAGMPRAEDEFPHELPDPTHPLPYKDTWMLSVHDHRADVTAVTHLTLSANRSPGLRITTSLRHGRRTVLDTRYETPTRAGDTISGESMSLRILNPAWTSEKHLRLTVRYPDAELELDFHGRFLGVDSGALTPGLIPSGSGVEGLGHAEQACLVSGWLRRDGQEIPIEGPGFRDRSWGYRKSDKMARHGYAFAQLHLPRGTCGLLSWQHPDASADQPLPVGAWLADDGGVHAATGGLLHLSAEGRLSRLELDFTGGRKIAARTADVLADVHYPYHEPEMDGPALGTLCWDQYLAVDTPDGPGTALLNLGIPFLADVLRNSRFCFAPDGSG